MTVPYYVNEQQSEIRAIKSGWSNGKLLRSVSKPGECLTGIFRVSPWLPGPLSVPNVEASTSGRALA
jgi:hypothetical protein